MVMRGWDPIRDLLTLQERMNRLIEDSLARRPEGPAEGGAAFVPAADVYETASGFVATIELPGVEQKDIDLRVDGTQLVLRGERRIAAHDRPESFHRMERSHGPFARTIPLGEEVDANRVQAELTDGVLRIELPKLRARSLRVRAERHE